MKAGSLGLISAGLASACCGLPLLLVAVGLGGLGLGSLLGTYHWYFTGAGAALLAVAWFVFLREKRRLFALGAEVRNARLTTSILALATAAVVGFGAVNLYGQIGLGAKAREIARAASDEPSALAQVILPVEGMSCWTCEITVEKALRKLEGVAESKASASEGKVLVRYRPGQVTFEQMVEAVNSTGYRANLPGS